MREGYEISYYRGNFWRDGHKGQYYYTLTFSYQFKYDEDVVYFAHSFPYTYSTLVEYMNQV